MIIWFQFDADDSNTYGEFVFYFDCKFVIWLSMCFFF